MHSALLCLALLFSADPAIPVEMPTAVDKRLKIELFAAEPDVRTPTGVAVDAAGRVLVIESHTHFRPQNYDGPPADRIRMYVDADGDGRAEQITTFFEGTTWTMNLGIHPDGSVYVATRSEVFRLRDTDGDGRADERTRIAHLETSGDYPHNGLSGFAFDFAGNVYFGLGENKGSEFKLIGTDGSVASELEGGQIYRCRADGSQVEMLAFGFWNPFHVAFDTFGRLLAVDNDPDSLPPCRLMHIVPGGNYGYRYRNGRKGVHPFTAWNGELPGTLPMIAGTGEAPSGVLAYESDQLPEDYVGEVLATSWGDHRIDRFHLEPRGASFRAVGVPIISGGENFRPVCIAQAPDGSLFVTDWVLKDYEVHGKGRIWHIGAADAKKAIRPHAPERAILSADRPTREQAARQLAGDKDRGRAQLRELAENNPSTRVRALAITALAVAGDTKIAAARAQNDPSPDVRAAAIRLLDGQPIATNLFAADQPAEVRAEAMRRASEPQQAGLLWENVSQPDAFLAEAARRGLARLRANIPVLYPERRSPAERLAWLLVLRETRDPLGPKALGQFLRDPDSNVRAAAIQWVGEERLVDFRPALADALAAGAATSRLFGGYLAALERLDGVRRESHDEWAGEQYIVRALENQQTTSEVRRWSLRMLRPDHPYLTFDRLRQFATGDDELLRLEAVRTLRESRHPERAALLSQIAAEAKNPLVLRCEAVVGLSGDDPASRALLLGLASGTDRALRDEALRSLRGCTLSDAERKQLESIAKSSADDGELLARVLQPEHAAARPAADDLQGWMNLLDGDSGSSNADAAAGERIFFHAKSAACSRCHQIGGRGARVGPELTATTGALARERLIESIVRPGKEIAPQFTCWLIATNDGQTHTGVLVHEEATGEQTYADAKGQLMQLKASEIAQRKPLATSIMPDGMAQLLTVQEFRDLLAFLRSQPAVER